jgi:hypothetical protein
LQKHRDHHCGREKEDETGSDAGGASERGDTAIDGVDDRLAGLELRGGITVRHQGEDVVELACVDDGEDRNPNEAGDEDSDGNHREEVPDDIRERPSIAEAKPLDIVGARFTMEHQPAFW